MPNGITDLESQRWHKYVLLLIGGLSVFRLVYLALLPIDLVHDEAYYWDWSRHLDFGYYSKPPGIAWLIGITTRLGESNEFFVRLPAAVLSTATLYFAFLLGFRLYDAKTGFFATALAAATPGSAALGTVMTIDAPFLCCWSAALYCFWRMLETNTQRTLWTMLTAITVGLGLLCKQTMIAFPALALVFVAANASHRRELRRPSLWLCGFSALVFLLPVVWWNFQHDWITLQHTGAHFSTESETLLKRVTQSGEFLATQLGVVSPVTCVLLIAALCAVVRSLARVAPRERYLLTFCAIPLAGILVLSIRQRVEPNWPAPFYASGMVLLAGVATTRLFPRLDLKAVRRAIFVGALTTAATYALPFIISSFGLKATKLDAVVRMWGWEELGKQVGQELATAANPDRTMVLVTGGRALASELAFYLPTQPEVYLWNPADEITSQYDVWGLPEDRRGWDVLIVGHQPSLDPRLRQAFETVTAKGEIVIPIAAHRAHRVNLWQGEDLASWPAYRTAHGSKKTGLRR